MKLLLKLGFLVSHLLWIGVGLLSFPQIVAGQKLTPFSGKYLMLDRYGIKRIRLPEGSEIYFKLLGDKAKNRDYIGQIWEQDSAVYLVQSKRAVPLHEFYSFHFRRPHIDFLSRQMAFVGAGFLFAAAVAELIPTRLYEQGESAVVGGAILASSQALKLFRWKNFRIKPGKSRIRIINTSWN